MIVKSVSIRLREEDLEFLDKMTEKEGKNRSEVIRELVDKGHRFDVLKKYKEGTVSIGSAAKELDMTVGEFMDLLSDLGIKSPVAFEDYKEGIKSLETVF